MYAWEMNYLHKVENIKGSTYCHFCTKNVKFTTQLGLLSRNHPRRRCPLNRVAFSFLNSHLISHFNFIPDEVLWGGGKLRTANETRQNGMCIFFLEG